VLDALITAAARALAKGDPLAALQRVALRDDPPALALRGIAMAQLGDYPRARELLRSASRQFGNREPLSRARCDVAAAEVALAMRNLGSSPRALESALATLEAHADRANALQARLVIARRLLLLGRLDEATETLARLDTRGLPPALSAVAELTLAEIALRSLRVAAAQAALTRALRAAGRAGVPALRTEVEEVRAALIRPAARRFSAGTEQELRLHEIASLLESGELVVDACRRGLRSGDAWVPLARRPILFTLLCTLAANWPNTVDRGTLISHAFKTRSPDETHRARLRVEIGRLRRLVSAYARIDPTPRGFMLVPHNARSVSVLAPSIDTGQAALLALLADGMAWSTSALALALGDSQRTVQRALVELESSGRVRSIGRARAQRWLAPPLTGITTILLLPGALSLG
jgi:tetratricopeptide (TPR) repeat protein